MSYIGNKDKPSLWMDTDATWWSIWFDALKIVLYPVTIFIRYIINIIKGKR